MWPEHQVFNIRNENYGGSIMELGHNLLPQHIQSLISEWSALCIKQLSVNWAILTLQNN